MKRSKFSLSNYKLLTCDMGLIIPIGLTEILPGDSIQQSTSCLVRASPLVSPVMHPVHVGIRHFFVPNRLVWDDWEKFITGGPDGMDTSVFPTITITPANGAAGGLPDYMGIPTPAANTPVSALPFRAFNLIYNEFFRDQDLSTPATISTASGADATTSLSMRRAMWEKDYFTSARPWEQKGPGITIPLGSTAPVVTTNANIKIKNSGSAGDRDLVNMDASNLRLGMSGAAIGAGALPTQFGATTGLQADLSTASAVTVNVLREAMALQRYEEARARFGSRYTEYLRYLGVRSSDARLQRPEYLGGGTQTIQFSEVLQTAEGTEPVGSLAGHGISAMRSNRYRRFFEEHGHVISVLYCRPKTMYMQGLKRHWNRRTKEDYWQKELQHIGQQEVFNKELYVNHTTPNGIFGYQDRYDEYRRTESTVAGEMRTTVNNHWHFARDFSSDPALNATFVACTPTERPFADQTSHTLQIMAHHSIQARRMVAASGSSFIF